MLEGRPTSTPFVGRRRELEELRRRLEGAGAAIFVRGHPGVGKTRLVEEFSAEAAASGWKVLRARFWDHAELPPYWPWRKILRELEPAGHGIREGLDAFVHGEGRPEGVPSSEAATASRFELFDRIGSLLGDWSSRTPLLLAFDDIHAADVESLQLLTFLARTHLRDARVVIVGTCRDLETRADSARERLLEEAAHPDGILTLGPLSEAETVELVRARDPDADSRAIHRQSLGNPLVVHTLLEAKLAPGSSHALEGNDSVRGAIRKALSTVPDEARDLLEVCAVLGGDLELETLQAVSGLPLESLHSGLMHAASLGVVRIEPERGGYAFAHPLFHSVLYEQLGLDRRATLHERAARSLEDPPRISLDRVDRIAHHHREAARAGGPAGPAVRWLREAGENALAMLAPERAERHFRDALDLGPGEPRLRARLLIGKGIAQLQSSSLEEGRTTLLEAGDLARGAGDAKLLAEAVLGIAGDWITAVKTDPQVVRLLNEAYVTLGDEEPALRSRLCAASSIVRYWQMSPSERQRTSGEAVSLARASGDGATLSHALEARHMSLLDPDHAEARLEAVKEWIEVARDLGDVGALSRARRWRLQDLLELGDRTGFDEEISILRELEDRLPRLERSLVTVARSAQAMLGGELERAEELSNEAFELARPVDPAGATIRHVCQIFAVRHHQGRVGEMEESFATLAERIPQAPIFPIVLAYVRACEGRPDEARKGFELFAANDFGGVPRDATWYCSVTLLAETAVLLADERRGSILYEVLSPLADRIAVFGVTLSAAGPLSHSLGILAALGGRFDVATGHFRDALEVNRRMGNFPCAARVQRDWARALLARRRPGDEERAGSLVSAALTAARSLGMIGLEEELSAFEGAGEDSFLEQRGDVWAFSSGDRALELEDTLGMRVLAMLLARPHELLSAVELARSSSGRKLAPERARVSTTRAFRRTLRRLAEFDRELAHHIDDSVTTGAEFRYAPLDGRRWRVRGTAP